MQIRVFTVSLMSSEVMEDEVNKFLRSHRVLMVDRHFSAENGGYWTLLVTYQETRSSDNPNLSVGRGKKVDYREVLSPEEFGRFALMRDVRKEVASQQVIPAYAVFTDEELAQMACMENLTIESIASIKGVGKRAEKFGEAFINLRNTEKE